MTTIRFPFPIPRFPLCIVHYAFCIAFAALAASGGNAHVNAHGAETQRAGGSAEPSKGAETPKAKTAQTVEPLEVHAHIVTKEYADVFEAARKEGKDIREAMKSMEGFNLITWPEGSAAKFGVLKGQKALQMKNTAANHKSLVTCLRGDGCNLKRDLARSSRKVAEEILRKTILKEVRFRNTAIRDAMEAILNGEPEIVPEDIPPEMLGFRYEITGGADTPVTYAATHISLLDAVQLLCCSGGDFEADAEMRDGIPFLTIYPRKNPPLFTYNFHVNPHSQIMQFLRSAGQDMKKPMEQFGVHWPDGSWVKYEAQVKKVVVHNTDRNLDILDMMFAAAASEPVERLSLCGFTLGEKADPKKGWKTSRGPDDYVRPKKPLGGIKHCVLSYDQYDELQGIMAMQSSSEDFRQRQGPSDAKLAKFREKSFLDAEAVCKAYAREEKMALGFRNRMDRQTALADFKGRGGICEFCFIRLAPGQTQYFGNYLPNAKKTPEIVMSAVRATLQEFSSTLPDNKRAKGEITHIEMRFWIEIGAFGP